MRKYFLFLLACVCLLSAQPAVSLAAVIVNEICWMGNAVSANDEWIELFNNGQSEISLDGWLLKSADEKLKINLKGIIPGQGFFLLERTDDTTLPDITADLIYKGSLSNNGEALILIDNNGIIIDQIDCQTGWPAGDNKTKQTMERAENGWQTSPEPGGTPKAINSQLTTSPVIPSPPEAGEESHPSETPEQQNTGDSSAALPLQNDDGSTKPAAQPELKLQIIEYPKNIFINEILPSPEGPDDKNEWVEVLNANDFTVNLAGWRIKDTVGATKTYTLPQDSQIAANGFLLIPRTRSKITLQNNGDGLELYNPNGDLLDQVIFPSAPNNQSYNRGPNGWVWSSVLTPGAVNQAPSSPKQTNSAATTKQGAISSTSSPDSAPSDIVSAVAQIGRFAPKSSRLPTFILAVAVAIGSAIIVLFLKKKTKKDHGPF